MTQETKRKSDLTQMAEIKHKPLTLDQNLNVGIVGIDDLGVGNLVMVGYLKSLGIKKIHQFETSSDAIEILKILKFSIIFVLQEIKDVHWTNFIRKMRTDEEIPFTPICLVLKKNYNIQNDWKHLLDDYKVRKILHDPFTIRELSDLLEENARDDEDEQSMQMRLRKASLYFHSGLIEQAKMLYSEILPNEDNFVVRSGLMQSDRENMIEFKKHLDHILEVDPANFSFRFELLDYSLRAGSIDKFNTLIDEIFTELLQEKTAFWLRELGETCLKIGYGQYTIKIAEHILKTGLSKENWRQYLMLARAQLADNRLEEAKLNLGRASDSCLTQRADIFNLRGVIARRNYEYTQALSFFEQALSLAINDHRIIYNVAIAYKDLKQDDKCIEFLKKALALAPDYEKAKRTLKQIQARQQEST